MDQLLLHPEGSAGSVRSAQARVLHIAIAIVTYRRPQGLERLLDAISRQTQNASRPFHIAALVVDNDASQTARPVVERFSASSGITTAYAVEERLGIPFARNRALDMLSDQYDYVAFLDDDEWPVETWLDEMLKVIAKTGADCVWGPVEPVYECSPPQYVARLGLFAPLSLEDCGRIPIAATNNVIFDPRSISLPRIRFDERLRHCGGSSSLFFKQAANSGMKIFWSERAVVKEFIPRHRLKWSWIARRHYRIGNNAAMFDMPNGEWRKRPKHLALGFRRILSGLILLPISILPGRTYGGYRYLVRAISNILQGSGMVGQALSLGVNEYSPSNLANERPPNS